MLSSNHLNSIQLNGLRPKNEAGCSPMIRRCGVLLTLMVTLLFTTGIAAQDGQLFPQLPGQIAYIGSDRNVYTLNLSDSSKTALSNDSSIARFYQWPTWSSDGRLAYFLTSHTPGRFTTEVLVSPDGTSPGKVAYIGENEVFNYAYWSPQNCMDGDEKCRDLAVLLSDARSNELFIELVRDEPDALSNNRIGAGAPFYFSWSPDGTRLLWQRGNVQLDIFDTTTNNIVETLNVMPGFFRAPAWSPIDDRLLVGIVSDDGETTNLTILTPADQQVLANNLRGTVSFIWSPNGDYIAYMDQQGVLWVVDSRTSSTVAQSAVSGVGAFFWSPDSRRIAFVTLSTSSDTFSAQRGFNRKVSASLQNPAELAWSVLDIQTGVSRRFGAFFPTAEMLYMLTYFDQFSQSHRIWSPDNRYIIYAERTSNTQSVINLLDTAQSNAVPFALVDGLIGVWSFQ